MQTLQKELLGRPIADIAHDPAHGFPLLRCTCESDLRLGRPGIYAIGENWSTAARTVETAVGETTWETAARDIWGRSVIIDVMFVDRVTIYCQAGDGGSGCMAFRREAPVPKGGPSGGDGGKGGDVVILADENVSSLPNIVGHKHWRGGRGEHGMGSSMTGKGGEDVIRSRPSRHAGSRRGPRLSAARPLPGRRDARGCPRRPGRARQQAFHLVHQPGPPAVRAGRSRGKRELSRSN